MIAATNIYVHRYVSIDQWCKLHDSILTDFLVMPTVQIFSVNVDICMWMMGHRFQMLEET
jgi:hypothetical protein